MKIVKAHLVYIIIAGLFISYYTYAAFAGKAFWEDNGINRNAGYTGPIPHSGYGVRFYHK